MHRDETFDQLYRQYYQRVTDFFITLGFDAQKARDLAQETFIRVYRSIDT